MKKAFPQVAEVSEFWQFIEGPFYNTLFDNNADACTVDERLDNDNCDSRRGAVFGTDFVLLDVRFKQSRVKRYVPGSENSPEGAVPRWIEKWSPDTWRAIKEQGLYPEYSVFHEESVTPFNHSGPTRESVRECFNFKERKLDWTTTGVVYPYLYSPSGYSCFLNSTKDGFDAVKQWLVDLRVSRWVDPGTRLILIDFALYSASVDKFLFFRLGLEQAPTGGLVPMWETYAISIPDVVHPYTLTLRIMLGVLILIFFVQEISEWHHDVSCLRTCFYGFIFSYFGDRPPARGPSFTEFVSPYHMYCTVLYHISLLK